MSRPVQTGAGPADVLAVMHHSPGPWRAEPAGIDGSHLLSANGNWIATIHGGYSDHDEDAGLPDTDDHDHSLLVAAPAILAELIATRAAVAELVEAAHNVVSADDLHAAVAALETALAKFGGA